MRILVCGSRNFDDRTLLFREMDVEMSHHARIEEMYIIQGEAAGADALAKEWAKERGVKCSTEYKADWMPDGVLRSSPNRFAGYMRNLQMLIHGRPQLVMAFPREFEENKGTKQMIRLARDKGIEVKMFWQTGAKRNG